jgi:hypothetical protein
VVATDYRKVFKAVAGVPRYQRNLDWGEARHGHPEGTVRAHITEYWKVRLLIHVQDSFKGEALEVRQRVQSALTKRP